MYHKKEYKKIKDKGKDKSFNNLKEINTINLPKEIYELIDKNFFDLI